LIGVRDVLDDMVGLIPPPDEHPEEIGVKPGTDAEVRRHPTLAEPFSAVVFKTLSEAHLGEMSLFRVFSGSIAAGAEVLNANTGKPERIGALYDLVGKERKEIGKVVAGDIAAAVKLKETHTGNTLCDKGQPCCSRASTSPIGRRRGHPREEQGRRGEDRRGVPAPARGGPDAVGRRRGRDAPDGRARHG
jgi:translation elongation factor EF-G